MDGPGRPKAIPDDQLEMLRAVVERHRGKTMEELCKAFARRTGVKVSTVTLRKAMRRACVRSMHPRERFIPPTPRKARRGRRNESEPRIAEPGSQAGCLTDAEWALAADLFELPDGHRGRPPKYERRAMVDACCYVLRTGCAWTHLPKGFPPWLAVHKSFGRWAVQGKFEKLQERMQEQWRQRLQPPVKQIAIAPLSEPDYFV